VTPPYYLYLAGNYPKNTTPSNDKKDQTMVSFWDKYERRQREAAENGEALRAHQIELWGWCDERPRDGVRTWHNGWAGNLVKRPPGHERHAEDVINTNLPPPKPITPRPSVRIGPDDEELRWEIETLAELFEYVSAAWDAGGNSYCSTKLWFSCGLEETFQGFAAKEGLPQIERTALSIRMRAVMPPCRNCRCVESQGRKSPAKTQRKLPFLIPVLGAKR
jgi:hypothetical protein